MPVSFRMRIYLALFFAVITGGLLGLMLIEGFSPLDAFYFLIVTIATVGYGDIHPVSVYGKILVIIIIITGVGCFIGIAANSIEAIIDEQERRIRIQKLNMAIGIFYSEAGTTLLRQYSSIDPSIVTLRSYLIPSNNWSDKDFADAARQLSGNTYGLDSRALDLPGLHVFLSGRKELLLALLQNPHLLEHETFTHLLQALFHLLEELDWRSKTVGFTGLPETDYAHLSGDINRVYRLLVLEWLSYMEHLRKNYPYLFSLAMRTNPFDASASPIVKV
jgi:hypothetical protein